jgi:hypothetical protein
MGDAPAPTDFACVLRGGDLDRRHDPPTIFPFRHEMLGRAAIRIIKKVRGINRVVYDIASKPPGAIDWRVIPSSEDLRGGVRRVLPRGSPDRAVADLPCPCLASERPQA